MPSKAADVAAAVIGCVLVLLALALIWISRVSITRDLYVSEMGAVGEPTAQAFQIALLCIVVGGSLIAYASRDIRSSVRLLGRWSPAVSLWIACGFFLVASQVTCTSGCPVPYGPSFTWQDFTHILAAVLAFVAACWAMLQVSFAHDARALAIFSRVSGLSVGIIAATGGLLSLAGIAVGFGSRLEFVATTIAIAWVAVYGLAIAVRKGSAAPGSRGSDASDASGAGSPLARDDVEQAVR